MKKFEQGTEIPLFSSECQGSGVKVYVSYHFNGSTLEVNFQATPLKKENLVRLYLTGGLYFGLFH